MTLAAREPFVWAAFSLVAVCYGLARFAYGLFLPAISVEIGLSHTLAGTIGSAAFASYCAAITVSAVVSDRIGARMTALLAGLAAFAGMGGMALARTEIELFGAVVLTGIGTGLVSPPLALAVSQTLPPERQGAANTLINSGTSAGIVLTGPIALLLTGAWREAYAAFALIAAVVSIWVVLSLPGTRARATRALERGFLSRQLGKVILAAFLMGAASASIWTFGAVLLKQIAGSSDALIAEAWVVAGLAGFSGAAAGPLIARFGLNRVHTVSLWAMAAALFLVIFSGLGAAAVFVAMAVFGATYVMLTGVILVWGVEAVESRPAIGLGAGFLAIAMGQVAGAPLFGFVFDRSGPECALCLFALLSLSATAVRSP